MTCRPPLSRCPLGLLPLALLAACGGPAPSPTPSATATATGGYVAQVKALSPRLRAGVLLRAIRDAERPCQGVTGETTATATGGAAWVATCDDGGQWVVAIADDGTATVADARDVARQRRR